MLKTSSVAEQVATHLRDGLKEGRWTVTMPGSSRLSKELGVHSRTIDRALILLEEEGLIRSQGVGRRRQIVAGSLEPKQMQIGMLLYSRDEAVRDYVFDLKNRIEASGHAFSFAPKTLGELKNDPKQVTKLLQSHSAKAWILQSAGREVLEAISQSNVPGFALFGDMRGLPIAGTGPDHLSSLREIMHQLFKQGHQRIVMIARDERRKAGYGVFEQVFLEELRTQDLPAGSYNLPEWEDTPKGLERCLDELFRVTPPTAIIVQDWVLMQGIQNYLARRRGLALRKIALICLDSHPCLNWCIPMIPHVKWDHGAVVRRVVRWVNMVAKDKNDCVQRFVPSKFVGGEVLEML